MIEYSNNQQPKQPSKYRKPILLAVIAVVLIIAGGLLLWWWRQDAEAPIPQPVPSAVVESKETPTEPESKPKPDFNKTAIQKAVDQWVGSHKGTYGVMVTTQTGNSIADHNGDKSFFAASIYKLYVAYEGYRKIDDGTHKLNQPYLGKWTRGECLDKMIRESHSPCAEKLWGELGHESLDAKMQTYGLTNTSMTSISTTPKDAAVMLARIQTGEGLRDSSRKKLLASMKAQIYDDALKTGFAQQTVYDKVGFRDLVEYHDVGIVKFKDGRVLIVAVFTEKAGTRNIAGLGQAIATAAKKP